MRGANLDDVKWSHPLVGTATLPDGTTWTEETDLTRFMDDEHPHHLETPE
ncbi:MAG: hypothetical protein KC496_00685 [Anaerolineae bacterium]|nr:hypothetical protein [Anaerolineae bacterium]